MQQKHIRALAGVALAALVITTTTPRLAAFAQPRAATPSPAPSTLPVASQPTTLPYPAYGTPAPGVNSGVANPNVPQVITLDQAIAIGYAQSPLLAQARAQLAVASAPVALARTAILPNIAGTASTSRNFGSGRSGTGVSTGTTTGTTTGTGTGTGTGVTTGTTTTSGGATESTSNSLSLSLRQLIFDGGKVAAQLRSAQNNQSASAATYKRQLQTVAFNVANAYYNSLGAQRATAVGLETVRVNQVNEQLVAAQIAAGVAARADLSTAQLPTAQARLVVVRAQGTELSAEATFANTMGLDANTLVLPRDDTPVNGAPVTSTVAIPTYDLAIARAIALRPDVSAQSFSVASNRESVRAASLGLFPTLNGTASTSTSSTDTTGGNFRPNSGIGVTLSIPLFDQGITKAQTASAKGNLDLAIANQQQTIQNVQLNVKQTLVALVTARAALDQANAELTKAQDVLRSTQAQYKAGVTTLPLLLNAQVGLTQALTDQSTAVYTLRQSEQAFLYAEGANGAP